eukprot:366512-Chlamydomonas_euryale.AAC.1
MVQQEGVAAGGTDGTNQAGLPAVRVCYTWVHAVFCAGALDNTAPKYDLPHACPWPLHSPCNSCFGHLCVRYQSLFVKYVNTHAPVSGGVPVPHYQGWGERVCGHERYLTSLAHAVAGARHMLLSCTCRELRAHSGSCESEVVHRCQDATIVRNVPGMLYVGLSRALQRNQHHLVQRPSPIEFVPVPPSMQHASSSLISLVKTRTYPHSTRGSGHPNVPV